MHVKIVVHEPTWLTRMQVEGKDALLLLRAGLRRTKQLLCALRGHRYEMAVQRRRIALHCSACGHHTAGWDLSDSAPRRAAADQPTFLELLRKRG